MFELVLASFAVYRVADLVTRDNGPWHVFRRLRECSANPMWCELMSCFYCQSLWWAAAAVAILSPSLRMAPLWWLAIAGGAVAIFQTVRPRP